MAKSRRAQRRERRTYKQWLRKEQLKKLKRLEDLILGVAPKTAVEWEARWPGHYSEVRGMDRSASPDDTVVITGTQDQDGTYTIVATFPDKYGITARVR